MARSRKSRSRSHKSRSHRKSSRKTCSRSRSYKKKGLTAYCVGCGKPHAMGPTRMKKTKNNRKMAVGKCSRTGVKMCRFV